MAVFMPTTSPRTLSSGPPELPGLMAASVCSIVLLAPRDAAERPARAPLITPTVTVWPEANGLPIAMTQSPGCICDGVAELRLLERRRRHLGELEQRGVGQRVVADDLGRVAVRRPPPKNATSIVRGPLDDVVVREDEPDLSMMKPVPAPCRDAARCRRAAGAGCALAGRAPGRLPPKNRRSRSSPPPPPRRRTRSVPACAARLGLDVDDGRRSAPSRCCGTSSRRSGRRAARC